MLPRASRLKRKDFPKNFRGGKTIHGTLITLSLFPSTRGVFQSTVVVSGKVSKSAVKRNRIKRLMRVALIPLLPSLSPQRAIFSVKVGARDATAPQLREEIKKLLINAHLL